MTVVCRVAVATVWSSPGRVRPVDSAAVQADPDVDAWVAAMSPEDRVDLQGRTETQLTLGEPVQVIAADGEWSQVVVPGQSSSKSPDGYPGWVPTSALGEADGDGEPLVVAVPRASVLGSAGWLSLGTTLPVLDRADGRVRLGPVWVADTAVQQVGLTGASTLSALEVAEQLLGVPYAWGGCSAAGIDCSGLIMVAHRVLGRPVPRDAHDQLAAAQLVPLSERRRGDILFFARDGKPAHHVGFDAGDGRLLHASMDGGRGDVQCVPMPAERADTLVAAGRFLPAP